MEAAADVMLAVIKAQSPLRLLRAALLIRKLPKSSLPPLREARLRGRRHSPARDRAATGFHYDQPVAFYRTFLDENLVYSCAYFDDGVNDLAAAQLAKIDHSLRKLRLHR